MIKTQQPAKAKIVTIWPFTEKLGKPHSRPYFLSAVLNKPAVASDLRGAGARFESPHLHCPDHSPFNSPNESMFIFSKSSPRTAILQGLANTRPSVFP